MSIYKTREEVAQERADHEEEFHEIATTPVPNGMVLDAADQALRQVHLLVDALEGNEAHDEGYPAESVGQIKDTATTLHDELSEFLRAKGRL